MLPNLLIDAKAVTHANPVLLLPPGGFQNLIDSLLEGNYAKASVPKGSPFLSKEEQAEKELAEKELADKEPADIFSSAAVNTIQPILDLLPLQSAIPVDDEGIDPRLVSEASAIPDRPRLSLSSPVTEPLPAPIRPSVNAEAIGLMVEVGKEQGILVGPQSASQEKGWIDLQQEEGANPNGPKISPLVGRSIPSQDLNGNPVRNSSGALNPAGIGVKYDPALGGTAEQWSIISNGANFQEKTHLNDEAREPLPTLSNQADHFLFSNHEKDSRLLSSPPQGSPNVFKQNGEEASQEKGWIDLQQEEGANPNGPKIISLVDRSIPSGDLNGNPVRNSTGALNPAGIGVKYDPALGGTAEQRSIISNGANFQEKIHFSDEAREPLPTLSNQSDRFLFSDREKDGRVRVTELDRSSRFFTKSESSPTAEIETKSPSSESQKEPSDIYRQIGKELIRSLRYHEERVRLTLDPPQLGRLSIEIKRDQENVRATLWTDNPVTKEILEAQQVDLHRMLREDGFKLEKFDVFFQQGEAFQERKEDFMACRQETRGTHQEQKEVSSDLPALSPAGSKYVDRFI